MKMASEFKEQLLLTTDGHYSYCGKKIAEDERWHIDHIIPMCRGGRRKNNLTPSCERCNLRKGGSTPEEFRRRIKKKAYKVTASILPDLEELCKFIPNKDIEIILGNYSEILDCISETSISFYTDEEVAR